MNTIGVHVIGHSPRPQRRGRDVLQRVPTLRRHTADAKGASQLGVVFCISPGEEKTKNKVKFVT